MSEIEQYWYEIIVRCYGRFDDHLVIDSPMYYYDPNHWMTMAMLWKMGCAILDHFYRDIGFFIPQRNEGYINVKEIAGIIMGEDESEEEWYSMVGVICEEDSPYRNRMEAYFRKKCSSFTYINLGSDVYNVQKAVERLCNKMVPLEEFTKDRIIEEVKAEIGEALYLFLKAEKDIFFDLDFYAGQAEDSARKLLKKKETVSHEQVKEKIDEDLHDLESECYIDVLEIQEADMEILKETVYINHLLNHTAIESEFKSLLDPAIAGKNYIIIDMNFWTMGEGSSGHLLDTMPPFFPMIFYLMEEELRRKKGKSKQ